MKLNFPSAGIKWYIRETNSSNLFLMCFGSGFGFTRWKGLPMKSKWFCLDIIHNVHLHPHKSSNFTTNWFLLRKICTPNPLMKYLQYLRITHLLHHLPQTLYCHANSPDAFTTEPLLLLQRCQPSVPQTAPTLRGDATAAAPVEAVPAVPQGVTGLPPLSVTHPLLCSPCARQQSGSCPNSPTYSTPIEHTRLAEPCYLKYPFHFDKQLCQQIWEGISLKQRACAEFTQGNNLRDLDTCLSVTATV